MVRVTYYSASALPSPERKEILRYAGAGEATEEVSALLDECLAEAEKSLSFGVCYRLFPIEEQAILAVLPPLVW